MKISGSYFSSPLNNLISSLPPDYSGGIACTPNILAMVATMVPTIFRISFQVSLLIFIMFCVFNDSIDFY